VECSTTISRKYIMLRGIYDLVIGYVTRHYIVILLRHEREHVILLRNKTPFVTSRKGTCHFVT